MQFGLSRNGNAFTRAEDLPVEFGGDPERRRRKVAYKHLERFEVQLGETGFQLKIVVADRAVFGNQKLAVHGAEFGKFNIVALEDDP